MAVTSICTRDICLIAAPQDAKCAEELAAWIRRYKLPKGVESSSAAFREGENRIAVDADGRAWDERAKNLLAESRWLLLLCSPQSRHSESIRQRYAYFLNLRGRERIIPVIVSGEPAEVMPEGMIEHRTMRRVLPDGTMIEYTETIEPVAADLRADSAARYKQLLRYETTRIVASVLDMHPDELQQRHRARERRTLFTVLAIAAAVSLSASAVFARLGLIARKEGKIADLQAQQASRIASRTMEELPERFEGEEQALAYIDEAVRTARRSLEELGLGDLLGEEEGE